MNVKQFANELAAHRTQLEQLMRRRLPVIVGRMAKDHYQQNFRKGGFQNRGLQKWHPTRRQSGNGTDSMYGPLLSRRNHLFASLKYVPSDFRVLVSNDLPYAAVHNWGGAIYPTVTPRMRRFAWAMYYANGGKSKTHNPTADVWRAMALTKKKRLRINIPQRQFIGDSHELNQRINERIENEIHKIINQ